MRNKKGFVLLETAVVLIIVVIAMLGLYSTYSFVFKSLKQSAKYDNIDDLYKLNIFYRLMKSKGFPEVDSTGYIKITSSDCTTYFGDSNCSSLMSDLGFNYFIYVGTDIDGVLAAGRNNLTNLYNTDINYMKTLEFNFEYLVGVKVIDNEYYYVSMKAGEIE